MVKMQFGITVGQAAPWSDLLATWRFLDTETSFHSAWLFDHLLPGGLEDDGHGICHEAWTALSALAQATNRIRLGVLVTGTTYRNPALLAKMATTVDHVSAGRLELGIGAGWHENEHRMFGYAFPTMRERQDRLEEAAQLIRLLFHSSEPVTFAGQHYRLDGAFLDPKPVQPNGPPLLVGGEGERRTLRTLARYGDVMDCGGPPAVLRHKIDVLERHCRDAGRDPAEIVKAYRGPIIVTENAAYIERIAEVVGQGYGMTPTETAATMPIGSAEHVREVVQQYAEAGVQRMVMLTQWPWKPEILRRVNTEVVEPFL